MRKKNFGIGGFLVVLFAFAVLFRNHIFPAVGDAVQDRKEESFAKVFASNLLKNRPEFFIQKTNLSGKNAQVYLQLQSLSKVDTEAKEYQEKLGQEVANTFCAFLKEPNAKWHGEVLNVFFVRSSDSVNTVFLSRSLRPKQCRA